MSMQKFSLSQIKKAASELSERYRLGKTPYLRLPEDREAYLLTRTPAIQAVLRRVLEELKADQITSYLDVGAGPGTSWDPVHERWPLLQKATFVEQDHQFVLMGKQLLSQKPIDWYHSSLENLKQAELHDLVLFSYSWGEILDLPMLEKSWALCRKFLVIVEPGTPRGCQAVLQARDELLARKGYIVAPCPHHNGCPWKNSSEWCHFGARVERSQDHQWIKEGSRNYEDEKFSYLIVARESCQNNFARLLKDPSRRKGHTILTLCTSEGIQEKIVSKKRKEIFIKINKNQWGDKLLDKI